MGLFLVIINARMTYYLKKKKTGKKMLKLILMKIKMLKLIFMKIKKLEVLWK